MKIIIGSDHAGYDYKTALIELVRSMGHTVQDIGTDSCKSVDYPDYAEKGAKIVASGQADIGILICGSGIGMDIAANKIKGIRSAVCWNEETARVARDHNSANILCLGERFLSVDQCIEITKVFLNTPLSHDERHLRRIDKIMKIEERNLICND